MLVVGANPLRLLGNSCCPVQGGAGLRPWAEGLLYAERLRALLKEAESFLAPSLLVA